jgi:hypothetical protein
MAVVRFSEELKDAIKTNATALFNKRLEALQGNPPAVGDEIIDKMFAPYMDAISRVPSEFLQWADSFTLDRIGNTSYVKAYTYKKRFPKPIDNIKTSLGRIASNYSASISLADVPEWEGIKAQLDEWKASIKAVEQQRDEFVSGVKAVINAHATLAPALKAWPPLWDLVPEEYKERHRKVVERSKPESAEIGVDLTKLTSTVVAAKFNK